VRFAARPMMCEWLMQADDQLPEELFEALVRLHAKYLRYDQYLWDELRVGGLPWFALTCGGPRVACIACRRVDLRTPYRRGDPRSRLDKMLVSLEAHITAAPETKRAFLTRLRNALSTAP